MRLNIILPIHFPSLLNRTNIEKYFAEKLDFKLNIVPKDYQVEVEELTGIYIPLTTSEMKLCRTRLFACSSPSRSKFFSSQNMLIVLGFVPFILSLSIYSFSPITILNLLLLLISYGLEVAKTPEAKYLDYLSIVIQGTVIICHCTAPRRFGVGKGIASLSFGYATFYTIAAAGYHLLLATGKVKPFPVYELSEALQLSYMSTANLVITLFLWGTDLRRHLTNKVVTVVQGRHGQRTTSAHLSKSILKSG